MKSSLVASHETLCNIVYDEEHPEPKRVRKFWRVSAAGDEIHEISEQEFNALQEEENITRAKKNFDPERLYENEDTEDPTTNDRV